MTGLPGDPKDVHVNVILNSERPKDFKIEPSPLGSLPTGPNGELIFRNDKHSGFFIYFDLIDNTGLNYKFVEEDKNHKKVLNEAVWSVLGANNCPTTGAWEVFRPRAVLNSGMTLKVRNTNIKDELGQFTYTLRVSKDDGASYHPLDPGGDNQNGPIGRNWSAALVFVSGAIAGSLATLGGFALLRG